MLKVGITGGIGSGKSTVCRIFESLGIPIYDADRSAKQLMVSDPTLIRQITDLLGQEAYTAEGQLDRVYVASRVFQQADTLQALNAIVHPAVAADGLRWHKAQKGVPYTLKEAALLFESGSYKALDKIISVYSPESVRIERVMQRDGVPRESVESRIRRQMNEEEKRDRADFVIDNGGQQLLIPQVLAIHRELRLLSDRVAEQA